MKIFKDRLDTYKNKKDLTRELKIYKNLIFKKLENEELNSALSKARSALTLIKEYYDIFDLVKYSNEFEEINQKVLSELNRHRNKYTNRLNRLLKQNINESNLERFMKLLTSLKIEVDKKVSEYNLGDVQANITNYFKFIKRLYIIFASHERIDYFEVSETIFKFMEDLKFENFPNLEKLSKSLLQKVIMRKLSEFSKKFKVLTISELSDKLSINKEELIEIIYSIIKETYSPIKAYTEAKEQVIFDFKKENI